ncbi:LLGL scribble cell polarity complex component 2 isoform X11 [Pipistrellus kuhlii]|uniref:LLGL scribble cell polarity complex component 2 isoform X11 n=1 Tax=Pipistrellus kuhlii TaxID=59472 RepID=UPI00174F536D|nr:LLGL scribble cell polarity complex component 2 isoform X11 [Pipistrellus kuhlii]
MRRFLRSGHDPARERLKRDLFQFNKTVEHGFPHQPSALGYSPALRILAIGTRSGAVKLYGAPGVEFMGLHRENNAVVQIHFLPGQCQLVTLLDDNSLHLWSLKAKGGVSELQEDESFTLRGPPGAAPSATQITVVLPHSSSKTLYLGTESGSVFAVQVPGFRPLEDRTISSDAVLQRLPEEARQRRVFEMVEALQEHPRDPNQVLIGYSRGLIVIWDLRGSRVLCHFLCSQQLDSVCWQRDGRLIVSCHSDGSYCQWPVNPDTQQGEPLRSCVPYGPFPCKAITKIFWLTTKQGLPFTIFQGGMPRASYGDRHCISVVHDGQQTAFDFTSRVIDFTVLREADPAAAFDDPSALVVLAEEELVVLDLRTAGWPPVQPPYLASLHCSAITCSHHVSNIPLKLWERIIAAGSWQNTHFSAMEWPVDGGTSLAPTPPQRDLLLTGHEDGTVRFWDASGVCLRLLYKLSTVPVFLTDSDPGEHLHAQGEDEWPPLRKVGSFDPYSDDPRLGIQKIFLCKYSGYLAVAGTAGQVLVLELNDEEAEHAVEQAEADLLQDQEGYRWKGHERLCARPGPVRFEPGFQPFVLVQCQPPAVVTSLALHSEWRLVAFGTSHGFGLFDHQQRRQVFVKCTLHPSDQLALEGPLSRVKSLKKSLRQSFRRMRRSRVSKRRPAGSPGEAEPPLRPPPPPPTPAGAGAERTGGADGPAEHGAGARAAQDRGPHGGGLLHRLRPHPLLRRHLPAGQLPPLPLAVGRHQRGHRLRLCPACAPGGAEDGRTRAGGAGQGDPADAPRARRGHPGAGRTQRAPPRAPGSRPRPVQEPGHAGEPPAARGVRGAVQGVHPAQGERQAEAEAHRPGGLEGAAGQRGPLRQLPGRGLRGAPPGGAHQPGRHPGGLAAPAQAAGALQLHPP